MTSSEDDLNPSDWNNDVFNFSFRVLNGFPPHNALRPQNESGRTPLPLLKSFMQTVELWRDPNIHRSILPQDNHLKLLADTIDSHDAVQSHSDFVIRITLDVDKLQMASPEVRAVDIALEIKKAYGQVLLISWSADIIRLRLVCYNSIHGTKREFCFGCMTYAQRRYNLGAALREAAALASLDPRVVTVLNVYIGHIISKFTYPDGIRAEAKESISEFIKKNGSMKAAGKLNPLLEKAELQALKSPTLPYLLYTTDLDSVFIGQEYDKRTERMGYPSTTPTEDCGICLGTFRTDLIIKSEPCGCFFCKPCLNSTLSFGYLNQQNYPPKCCCGREIGPWAFLKAKVVKPEILRRFAEIAEEYSIESPLYCGDKTCAKLIRKTFIRDGVGICSKCIAGTCVRCRNLLSVHDEEFEGKCPEDFDEKALREMAAGNKWGTCPTCNLVLERSEGCNHMKCVCGQQFCYACMTPYSANPVCECGLGIEHPSDDEVDEDEDDERISDIEDEDDEGDDSDEEEMMHWPRHEVAVGSSGAHTCLHTGGTPIPGLGRCHGCLVEVETIQRCMNCQIELCAGCRPPVRAAQ